MSSQQNGIGGRWRFSFPAGGMTVFAVITAITFAACSSAPTPLYHIYQTSLHLSPLLVTMIFAAYVFSLLVALLTVGSLSDYVGRRPVIFTALLLNAAAMLVFVTAESATALIAARVVQGFATGAATTTLGAAILDTDKQRGPLLNSITAFTGLMLGALACGILVSFAPLPTQLIYALLLGITLIEAAVLLVMPETTSGRSGALAALRPHVKVPAQAKAALFRVTPINVAAWALGGFYLSLMPTLVTVAIHLTAPVIGGAVVAALMFSAILAVLLLRSAPAGRVLTFGAALLAGGVAMTLTGVAAQQVVLLVGGTLVAGFGFGSAFSGTLRTILPLAGPSERAGLFSTYYLQSYLAFSLPAIVAGLTIPALGLVTVTYLYGALVMVLAASSLLAARPRAVAA